MIFFIASFFSVFRHMQMHGCWFPWPYSVAYAALLLSSVMTSSSKMQNQQHKEQQTLRNTVIVLYIFDTNWVRKCGCDKRKIDHLHSQDLRNQNSNLLFQIAHWEKGYYASWKHARREAECRVLSRLNERQLQWIHSSKPEQRINEWLATMLSTHFPAQFIIVFPVACAGALQREVSWSWFINPKQ